MIHDKYTNRFDFSYWNRNSGTAINDYTVVWSAVGF